MGKQLTIGLPYRVKAPRKQVTTKEGVKVVVTGRIYWGIVTGFNIIVVGKGIEPMQRFHNGCGFKNPFSVDEAMEWALKNMVNKEI